jgi:hypothetical protein
VFPTNGLSEDVIEDAIKKESAKCFLVFRVWNIENALKKGQNLVGLEYLNSCVVVSSARGTWLVYQTPLALPNFRAGPSATK